MQLPKSRDRLWLMHDEQRGLTCWDSNTLLYRPLQSEIRNNTYPGVYVNSSLVHHPCYQIGLASELP